jgi:TRAP-type C4-dicarboxylate transport system permease small subunit
MMLPSNTSYDNRPALPPKGGAFGALKRFVDLIDVATYGAIVVVMALMATMISLQVFWRYALGSSIDSADELSRLFFIWAIFLAIPHGVKRGVHVGIDLFLMMMPVRLREWLFRVVAAISMLLMLMVMLGAWTATLDRWSEMMPTLPVTSSIYFIPLLICGFHAALHLALLAWGGSRTWEEEAV